MEIKAVHIFKYPAYVTGHILPTFSPRVTIAGHVLQDVQELSDGTKLIIMNTMDFVRDYHQVVTVIAAMTPNNCWPIKPPTPKKNSPIRITGFIDCIDNQSRLPVVTIEELTLNLGTNVLLNLQTMLGLNICCLNRKFTLQEKPPYSVSHPELEYLPLRYPAPLSDVEELEDVCEGSAASELGLDDERGEDVETGDESKSSAEEAASAESEEEARQSASKATDSPTGNVALPMPGDNTVLSTPTDPGCATFQFTEADTFDSPKMSINSDNIGSLSGILNAAKTIDDYPMAHDPTENPQNNDSYPYPYQLSIFDMKMHIDSDDGSQLSQSDYEELSSFSATNHTSQPSIVPDANTLSTKGKDRAEPQTPRVRSMEQINFQVWKLFQEYTVRLRNLMVERAVQNTVIDHKYFFY
ncbi:hypothetical protein M422DRAFT_265243 [Sphaerobolus stellatus SS14]|uniref:Uncharacterized protein n=1 Tax=Sphaerobolus stellatus (strain SS14) TaxID=990650 RepID=A0A0C9UDY1_SPHS4|nr:hypothetical protein M422DRAFT_265243 [Sphaerobolus stellatus SS14]